MSDPTDREIAERNCPSDSHRPDKPGSYCECERILAALAEQREQMDATTSASLEMALAKVRKLEAQLTEADEQIVEDLVKYRELKADGRRLNWLLDQEIGYHGRSDIDAAIAADARPLDEQQYDNMAEEAGRLARELIRLKRKTDDR